MIMYKKTLLLALWAMTGTAAFAQENKTADDRLFTNTGGIYVKGGLNLANVSTQSDGSINSAKTRASFNVGLMGDIPLAPVLSLQVGAEFTGKGSRAQYNSSLYTGTYTFRPYYIEVPVNLVVKIPVAPHIAVILGGGGYGAAGVAGKYKTDISSVVGSGSSSQNIKWTNSDDVTTGTPNGSGVGVLRRYDFGLDFLAGVEVGPVQLSLNYGLGLTKLSSTADNTNDSDKNRVLSLNLAFRL
jgi:hypothetical protein